MSGLAERYSKCHLIISIRNGFDNFLNEVAIGSEKYCKLMLFHKKMSLDLWVYIWYILNICLGLQMGWKQ